MKNYILLVDTFFDWSAGEYGSSHVKDIMVGVGEYEDKDTAIKACEEIFEVKKEEDGWSGQFGNAHNTEFKAIETK